MNAVVMPTSTASGARRGLAHALQALSAIVAREVLKFSQQTGRLVSALVRPLLWLAVFAAGFRNVFGISIVEPYDTYIPYEVYIAPGLVGMVLLFNGMQSSLAMVYDREMGLMRLLLTTPLPRPWVLFAKLSATALLSVLQALAFVAVALAIGTDLPVFSLAALHALAALVAGAMMLGALGLLLSVHIKQLENFAGTMNFVIFPMFFLSSALYPIRRMQDAGADWIFRISSWNPFTHAVEALRHALYGEAAAGSLFIVAASGLLFYLIAAAGYDPQRG